MPSFASLNIFISVSPFPFKVPKASVQILNPAFAGVTFAKLLWSFYLVLAGNSKLVVLEDNKFINLHLQVFGVHGGKIDCRIHV